MSADRGQCRECGRPILWVRLPSGKSNPVDVHATPAPKKGLVAVRPDRGTGKVLAQADLDKAFRWVEQGVRFHVSHFATCRARNHQRRKPKPVDADAELARVQQKFPELAE